MTANSVSYGEIDALAEKIMSEIEHASSRELTQSDEVIKILHLTNVHHAKALLQHANEAPTKNERNVGKKAVIKALLISTWHQRLYFIIRSFIMGLLSALITFTFVLYFGSLTLATEIPLGISAFVISLAISRLMDVQIVRATKAMVAFLSNHKRARDLILNHF